jgi:hypothetical protein
MLAATIGLVVAGIFFPPLWIGAVITAIVFATSGRTRRASAIEDRVRRMVSARQGEAHFPDLYYEAAWGFAKDRGARAADNTSASATVLVGSKPYWVVFSRAPDGGTFMYVEDGIEHELRTRAMFDSLAGRTI